MIWKFFIFEKNTRKINCLQCCHRNINVTIYVILKTNENFYVFD